MPANSINLAVLCSGSGTTLQNLLDQIAAKKLDARIQIVIGSKADIRALKRAQAANLAYASVKRKDYPGNSEFSKTVFSLCEHADLICLAGWLCLLEIPDKWQGRVMNIHPALLPAFGGSGMYGHHVHQAVLDHGCKVSGCSVHFVDSAYDSGPIILQRTCPVLDEDTPDTLAARVFEEEKIAYPEAIRLFAAGRLNVDGRRVRILP